MKFGFLNSNDKKEKKEKNKKELVIKLCCVLFAVALWLMVVGQNPDIQYEMTYYAVPVTIRNANSLSDNYGLSIISGYDYNINITVRGNRAKLSNYTSEDIVASVDVSEIKEAGDYNLGVHVDFPPSSGFTVVSKSLENISVSIDKLTSIELDVDVNIVNAQYNTESYALGIPKVNPEKITVKGPQGLLNTIKTACVNLDLGVVSSTIGFNNRVVLLDSNNDEITSPYITLSEQFAEGSIPFISKEEATKIIEKSVKLNYNFKYGHYGITDCSVKISPEYVTLSGYESDLRKIDSIDVCTIDETVITSSTVFEVAINAPADTKLDSAQKTAVVTVIVSDDIDKLPYEITEIEFLNNDTELLYSVIELPTVNLIGDNSETAEFAIASAEDKTLVSAFVDVKLIRSPGTYMLPVIIEIDNGFDLWAENTTVYITVE